ncbi:MAG: hypothetical protein IT203_09965 [Fimbriimonadaceae bacterium]|nr:hypothetical protein [Fimbriimonadaceae bacterium]
MSVGRRAYDLMRGYVNREWDRIKGVEFESAERELQEALELPRQEERSVSLPPDETILLDRQLRASKILGVPVNAPFADIQKAFDRLKKRSDGSNFPSGSPEAAQAIEIQRRVQWAYGVLTEGMDVTERRFRSLEI